MDNHGSHLTLEFLEFCEERKIIVFPFPSHTIDILRPLDGNPVQVLQYYFRKRNNKVMRYGGIATDKADFLAFIPEIRKKAMKPETIIHLFCHRGIYPFNPEVVLKPLHEQAPSIPGLQFISGELGSPQVPQYLLPNCADHNSYSSEKN